MSEAIFLLSEYTKKEASIKKASLIYFEIPTYAGNSYFISVLKGNNNCTPFFCDKRFTSLINL